MKVKIYLKEMHLNMVREDHKCVKCNGQLSFWTVGDGESYEFYCSNCKTVYSIECSRMTDLLYQRYIFEEKQKALNQLKHIQTISQKNLDSTKVILNNINFCYDENDPSCQKCSQNCAFCLNWQIRENAKRNKKQDSTISSK